MNKSCCPHCGGGNWKYINGAPHCKKHRMCNKIPMLRRTCNPDILIVRGKVQAVEWPWLRRLAPLSPRGEALIKKLLKQAETQEPSTLTLRKD